MKLSGMRDPNQKVSVDKITGHVSVETVNKDPSLTIQSFKDECDINNIVARHAQTGEYTHLSNKLGQYADLTSITSYHDMVNQVHYANEAFETLPPKMRLRFKNDPGELLAFLQDRKNLNEAIELGLVDKTTSVPMASNDDKNLKTNDDKAKTSTQ